MTRDEVDQHFADEVKALADNDNTDNSKVSKITLPQLMSIWLIIFEQVREGNSGVLVGGEYPRARCKSMYTQLSKARPFPDVYWVVLEVYHG